MKGVTTFGHRRSGNHFVMETLKKNFMVKRITKSHRPFKPRFLDLAGPKLLVVRDGRDTLTACYHWWKSVKGSRAHMDKKTFHQYIQGNVPAIKGFAQADFITAPVDMWVSYMEGWIDKIPIIRFEDLKLDFEQTIVHVGKQLELTKRSSNFEPLDKLVGYSPRKGVVGDWKNHFNKKDEDIFWSKAKHIMYKLGYER